LLVRYDITKALIESGRLKPEELPESIRAGDPPRLKSPAEVASRAYNTIADVYGVATAKVPGAAQIQDKYLAEYSDRRVNVLISRQAEGKEGLKSKLGLE
jgi:hypothetical protein